MRVLTLALLLALGPDAGWANDSTALLKTSGLEFTKTSEIEMRSEELYISAESVNVLYRFFNHSRSDVAKFVAFPMPDLHNNGDGSDIAIPKEGDNFLGFETIVNGAPVPATLEQRAMVMDVDHTALLRELHVPLLPFSDETAKALDRVPAGRRQELIKPGLAEVDESQGTGAEHLAPRWTLQSAYTWRQVFPAGRELVVEHHYKPSVGSFVTTLLGDPTQDTTEEIRKYCVEPSLNHKMYKARRDAGTADAPYFEKYISYILKTGANWAAPIGDFRLVVDKGSPRNLVSFCGEGVRKVSPTQFEMRKRNFLPDANLDVLILTPTGG